jgi:PKD repeat protein
MSQVTGNTTVTAYVSVGFAGVTCNSVQIGGPQSLGVHMVNGMFNLAQDLGGDEQHALVGQLRTISHTPVATLSYEWDMGEGAVPSSYVGPSPPPVTYGTPGLKTVTLTTSSPMGMCSVQLQRTILVVDSAAMTDFPLCSSGTAGLGAYIADMCLDAYNNRYVTGFHAIGNPMEFAFFAMKLDSSGNEIWRYMGPHSGNWQSGTGGSYGYGIAADQAGNAYITGRFDHNGREIQGTTVAHPNFLVKFDRFGQLEWQLTSPEAKLKGVQVVSGDTIYVAGYNVWSGVSFLLPSGDLEQFTVTPSDPGHGNAFLLAVDPQGGLLAYDPFGHVHPANEPAVMSSMDMSSDPLDTDDRFRCDPLLRVTPDGGLVVSGLMRTPQSGYTTKFDNMELVSYVTGVTTYDRRQAFVVRYVPGSGVQSAYAVAGGDLRSIQGLSIGADGGAVLCGRFKSPLLFNGVSVEPQDPAMLYNRSEHSYLLRIAPEGSPQWHWTGGNRFTMLHDVAIAPDNSVYALLGFTATGVLKGSNDQAVGFGSGSTHRDHAVIHLASGGDLLSADQGEYGSGVAYNMRPDPCGDLHTIVLTPASGPGNEHAWVSCDGCTDNLKVTVIDVGGCAQDCFAAYDPGLRDVAIDGLALSDTTANEPEVRVSFRNVGQVPVQQVVMGYTVNEGPTQYVVWDGGLAYTEGVTAVPLGMLSFLERHSNRVVAWIDQVNGSSDDLASNDTLRLTHMLCVEPLQGTYSCGEAGGDFLTLQEATEALAVCGISASTTIAIAPGIYNEHLHIRPIPGITPLDTVIFTSANGDSASVRLRFAPPIGSGVNAVVALDSHVKGVTMTDLTIDHSSFGAGSAYGFYCEDLNFTHCHFIGRPFATQTGLVGDRASRRIRVDSCTFEFGSSGVHLFGVSHPDSPTLIDSLTWVRGNVFLNQTTRSLFLEAHVGLMIQGNTIISDDAYNSNSYTAVRATSIGGMPSAFDRNYIKVSTVAPPINGGANPNPYLVRLFFFSDPGVRNSVRNNMIINPLQFSNDVIPNLYCECRNADFMHNSVRGVSVLAASSPLSTDSFVVRNNIFISGASLFAVEVAGGIAGWVSDNNIFSSGPDGNYSIVIEYQGYNRSLSWWQANTGLDQGSLQLLPHFVAPDDLHLELGTNFFFCPSLPSVPTDIDGDLRGPIITRQGADEGDINVSMGVLGADQGLSVYPNPSTGRTVIRSLGAFNGPASLEFFDAQGRLVHVVPVNEHSEEFAMDLDLEDGMYVVTLRTGHAVVARTQLVITR